jgi:hypothetical protein
MANRFKLVFKNGKDYSGICVYYFDKQKMPTSITGDKVTVSWMYNTKDISGCSWEQGICEALSLYKYK